MSPAWIAPALVAAGAACLFAAFALGPRASAADSKSPPGWTLWSCTDGVCRQHGRPLGKTACLLDMASLAIVLKSGSRLACVRVEEIEERRTKR